MSAETIVTFAVTGVAAGNGPGDATAVAEMIAAHVDDPDISWGDPTPIGTGARLQARIGKRAVPVFVGPTPDDSAEAGRWFLSIGTVVMPLARVVGFRDGDIRGRMTEAVASALATAPGISAVRWRDDDDEWPGR